MSSIEHDEKTIKRITDNPDPQITSIDEVYRLIREGDINVAKITLRMLINMTCGFKVISEEVGRHPKSIMRMLTPDVDPGIRAFMAIVKATEHQTLCAKRSVKSAESL